MADTPDDPERLDSEADDLAATPGWDAISARCAEVHGSRVEHHLGTIIKWALGGPDPLDGVSIFVCDDHWHYVSYGLSELYEKESDDLESSGWGFELTFRLRHDGRAGIEQEDPPRWPVGLMQSLARYVFETGAVLGVGDHIDNGSVLDPRDAGFTATAVIEDPQLGTIDTPNGSVQFRQLVALTDDELSACKTWKTIGVIGLLAKTNPLLVSDAVPDPNRFGPSERQAVEDGADKDGSSYSVIYAGGLEVKGKLAKENKDVLITMNTSTAEEVRLLLRRRLGFGSPFWITAGDVSVGFGPADDGISKRRVDDDGDLYLELAPDDAVTLHERLGLVSRVVIVPGIRTVSIQRR